VTIPSKSPVHGLVLVFGIANPDWAGFDVSVAGAGAPSLAGD